MKFPDGKFESVASGSPLNDIIVASTSVSSTKSTFWLTPPFGIGLPSSGLPQSQLDNVIKAGSDSSKPSVTLYKIKSSHGISNSSMMSSPLESLSLVNEYTNSNPLPVDSPCIWPPKNVDPTIISEGLISSGAGRKDRLLSESKPSATIPPWITSSISLT